MTYAVCFGAHPDDVEIGMGGTIAALTAEDQEVALVDLTDGEPTPAGTPERRAREASTAAATLGVSERRTLSFTNRELCDTVDARKAVAATLRDLRPEVVFAPYPEDAHPDHVAAAAICEAARFYAKLTKSDIPGEPHYPPRLIRYHAVHLRRAFEPDFVVDVSATLEAKLQALACYESQFVENPRNAGFIEAIERQARWWGSLIGVDAGEPFATVEQLGLASASHVV